MADTNTETPANPTELLAVGRRHLAVKDFSAAVEALATACELLAKEHGDMADQCAEPYLWYGKSLLGLSREESGVLGDGMPGGGNAEEGDDDDDEDQEENGEVQNGESGEAEAKENQDVKESEAAESKGESGDKSKPESTEQEEPSSSKPTDNGEPGTSNGEGGDADESMANLENEDDVDNLQLAWEMLELSRSILSRRVSAESTEAARALLAEAHLALGEVALESETYDKAVIDMQSCLELQKELYRSDDRRIAETHYQIGLANSLASNFEDAITHFKNAANILESRIKTLENPTTAEEDATVKKYKATDPFYSIEGEIKELKELLPEIQEKIQDMMDYKAETIKRVRETLCPSNGAGSSSSPTFASSSNGAGSSSSAPKSDKPVSNISHLIKRKRKASDSEEGSAAKKAST